MPRRLLALVLLSFAAACGGVDDTGAIKGGPKTDAGAELADACPGPPTAACGCDRTYVTCDEQVVGSGIVCSCDPDCFDACGNPLVVDAGR